MPAKSIQLEKIEFLGPDKRSAIEFHEGVNVICGASDTGKSFLAEVIDFMLGGSSLREIPERVPYGSANLGFNFAPNERWVIKRGLAGGNFELAPISEDGEGTPTALKQQHLQGKTDNISGFFLDRIGLMNKRILKSKAKATTQSLSFRNLARLIIVQEGEIQDRQSPFLSGQVVAKTAELAVIKLLLTGVDDSAIVASLVESPDNARQLALIEEILSDLSSEISDMGHEKPELVEQLEKLNATLAEHSTSMDAVQSQLEEKVGRRKELFDECAGYQRRIHEISELLARFELLGKHYAVDRERLLAIQESGSMFSYIEQAPCPLCGASPDAQHSGDECDGDVEAIVTAANAEIAKIERLLAELEQTVTGLRSEASGLDTSWIEKRSLLEQADAEIRASISPLVVEARAQFSEVVEKRAEVQSAIGMFDRLEKLEKRKQVLIDEENADSPESQTVESGLPDAAAHALSMTIERILRAWHFPGECRVHFDKERSDFVIDGKPRGSRGKGLRAITHAAVNIGLMEYCREQSLPHPGFVVMDSPLLAYFKPEGDDDIELKGTDLKERFYEYLIQQHSRDSQVIIIENEHPPEKFEDQLHLTIFSGNPSEGRFGLL
jgi:predicted nuclease with TOPRIM domain